MDVFRGSFVAAVAAVGFGVGGGLAPEVPVHAAQLVAEDPPAVDSGSSDAGADSSSSDASDSSDSSDSDSRRNAKSDNSDDSDNSDASDEPSPLPTFSSPTPTETPTIAPVDETGNDVNSGPSPIAWVLLAAGVASAIGAVVVYRRNL